MLFRTVDLTTLPTREPCTCRTRYKHQHGICASCEAWEHGRVLLTDGREMSRAVWLNWWEMRQREGAS
jgi:hypothetical protein